MRQVRLTRPAYINESWAASGDVISISDATALAPYMRLIEAETVKPAAAAVTTPAAPQNHDVAVSYDETARTISITIDGVVTKLDHAELKLRMD